MNKRTLINLAVILAAALAFLAVRYLPGVLSERKCSLVYQHYAHLPGIEATFVKDYPVFDTLAFDVTLLHASSDTAWQLLCHDFGIKPLNSIVVQRHGVSPVTCRFAPKQDYSLPMDSVCRSNNDLLLISQAEQNICIFHTYNHSQITALQVWLINIIINKTPLTSITNEEQDH